jgi:hypothetical protein
MEVVEAQELEADKEENRDSRLRGVRGRRPLY